MQKTLIIGGDKRIGGAIYNSLVREMDVKYTSRLPNPETRHNWAGDYRLGTPVPAHFDDYDNIVVSAGSMLFGRFSNVAPKDFLDNTLMYINSTYDLLHFSIKRQKPRKIIYLLDYDCFTPSHKNLEVYIFFRQTQLLLLKSFFSYCDRISIHIFPIVLGFVLKPDGMDETRWRQMTALMPHIRTVDIDKELIPMVQSCLLNGSVSEVIDLS